MKSGHIVYLAQGRNEGAKEEHFTGRRTTMGRRITARGAEKSQ